MSKYRIALFSVLFCLLLATVLSLAGVLPNKFFEGSKKDPEGSLQAKYFYELHGEGQEGARVTQHISDFYFPSYDETGREVLSLKGKEAFLINDRLYKIKKPEVKLRFSSIEADTSEPIIITSYRGKMDKQTGVGLLTRNVVAKLDKDTTLKTESLGYSPADKKAQTSDPVTLLGQNMKIKGEGMEVDISTGRTWIERDVVAELEGVESNLLLISLSREARERPQQGKVYIRCSGRLVFEKEPNMATFHDNVRVRRGTSSLMAKKLVLVFGKDSNKPKLVIAEGDVLASDGEKLAKGKSLLWDAVTDATILEGAPVAEFFEEKTSIIAPKMIFHKNEDRVDVPRGGQLTTRGLKADSEGGMGGQGNVTITWRGKMNFLKAQEEAVFEEEVLLTRRDFKMHSQRLVTGFEGQSLKVKNMKATGGVYIIEKRGDLLRESYGEEAFWDLDKNLIEISGRGNLYIRKEGGLEGEGTNVQWAKKMTMDDKQKKLSFYEGVRATNGPQAVDCNQLNAFLDNNNKVLRVIALGDVVFVDSKQDGIEGIGDTLDWDWTKDLMVLSGSPQAEVRRKKTRTFADRVYYDLKTQRMSWRERPHWMIPVEGELPPLSYQH